MLCGVTVLGVFCCRGGCLSEGRVVGVGAPVHGLILVWFGVGLPMSSSSAVWRGFPHPGFSSSVLGVPSPGSCNGVPLVESFSRVAGFAPSRVLLLCPVCVWGGEGVCQVCVVGGCPSQSPSVLWGGAPFQGTLSVSWGCPLQVVPGLVSWVTPPLVRPRGPFSAARPPARRDPGRGGAGSPGGRDMHRSGGQNQSVSGDQAY